MNIISFTISRLLFIHVGANSVAALELSFAVAVMARTDPDGLATPPLPLELMHTCCKYKRDTEVAIQWLVEHGANREDRVRGNHSSADLETYTSVLIERGISRPASMRYTWQQAIAGRRSVHNYFLSRDPRDVESDRRHGDFIDR